MDDFSNLYSGNVFTKEYYGIYGTFTPDSSQNLEYLLTNISIDDFQHIKTASDVTEFSNVTFEEIIQRDIDYQRVDDELISQYLDKQDNNVKFFPPLLISIIPSKDATTTSTTTDPITELNGTKLITTFGTSGFQLHLNTSKSSTPHTVSYENQDLFRIPFASIKVNPNAVKLVVIDGQHRFEALRRMASNRAQRVHIEKIEVPVCIFFTRRDLSSAASINKDLRELFVTINSKQKEVSGHFIVLLDDKKLSAYIIRSLANKWKKEEIVPGRSALPLLEWNTRESRSAHQRLKKYSITTVSIIADCFSKYLLRDSKKGYTHSLLSLHEIKDELNAATDSPSYDSINDETFSPEQLDLIKSRIDERIVHPLNVLLRNPRPYLELANSFRDQLKNFEEQAQRNVVGINYYLSEVLYKYRKCSVGDQQASKDAEIAFEEKIQNNEFDDGIFFKLIFQQALIRSWAVLSNRLSRHGLSPADLTHSFTNCLDALVFKKNSRYFESAHIYTQNILFDGQRIIQNESSREAWVNIILSSLVASAVRTNFTSGLNLAATSLAELNSHLLQIGKECSKMYLDSLFEMLVRDYKKNWRHKDLSREKIDLLEVIENDPKEYVKFNSTIEEVASEQLREAKQSFASILSTNEIF